MKLGSGRLWSSSISGGVFLSSELDQSLDNFLSLIEICKFSVL